MFHFRLRTLLIVLALGPPLLALVLITVLGLGRKPPSAFGRVTYRGMPVAMGTVEFVPQFDDRSSYAVKTDEQGCYRLSSEVAGHRLRPGSYRVTIDWPGDGSRARSQLIAELRPESENQIDFDLQ